MWCSKFPATSNVLTETKMLHDATLTSQSIFDVKYMLNKDYAIHNIVKMSLGQHLWNILMMLGENVHRKTFLEHHFNSRMTHNRNVYFRYVKVM